MKPSREMNSENLQDEPSHVTGAMLIDPLSRRENNTEEYQHYLKNFQFDFVINYPYLNVLTAEYFEGWALHISVVIPLMHKVLDRLLPLFSKRNISFDIPLDKATHHRLLSGNINSATRGKIINVYPLSDIEARHIAMQLIELMSGIASPDIPDAIKLGNGVFTSDLSSRSWAGNHDQRMAETAPNIKDRVTYPWPFRNLKAIKKNNVPKIIRKFVLSEIIKDDPKGKVFKAIKFSWTLSPTTFLIKQGLQGQSYDDHHRDIRNRLLWQYRVHQVLQGQLNVPKVYDYFEMDDNGYLVLEFIEGESLSKRIQALYAGKSFADSEPGTRLKIIMLARKVVFIVEKLHSLNYLHRDLNPQNFIFASSGELYLTDFELSFSINMGEPNPPFGVGTPGYMHQEQFIGKEPSLLDDLYAVAGVLIKIFTGCSPLKFENSDPTLLENQLAFFINKIDFAKEIASLRFSRNAGNLRNSLHSLLADPDFHHLDHLKVPASISAIETIYKGLNIFQTGLYRYKATEVNHNDYSLNTGLSGILFCLAGARKAGLLTRELEDLGFELFRELSNNYLSQAQDQNSALFTGTSGVALTISELLDAGLINSDHVTRSQLTMLFMCNSADGNDIATGKAGFGLAILKCLPHLEPGIASRLLTEILTFFKNTQNAEGSWDLAGDNLPPGLFYGISGILCFLLAYQKVYNEIVTGQLISKGLDYLFAHKEFIMLTDAKANSTTAAELFGLGNGIHGIALMLMRAYEYIGDKKLKDAVYRLLQPFPDFPTTDYLDFEIGLAGLGEVYLEAYRIFGDQCWQIRSDRIAGFLLHTGSNYDKNALYWMTVKEPKLIPGFLNGQAGVLHFLMRYLKPDILNFPLI